MAQITLLKSELKKECLPTVCAVCGQPSVIWRKHSNYRVTPLLIIAGVFLILAVAPILFLMIRKEIIYTLPFCQRHRNHWKRMFRYAVIPLIAAYTCIFTFAISTEIKIDNPKIQKWLGISLVAAYFLFVGFSIIASILINYTSIRIVRQSSTEVKIAGLCVIFKNTLELFRQERSDGKIVEESAQKVAKPTISPGSTS